MKNIHLLPTDKPSRLHTYNPDGRISLLKEPKICMEGFNIYITSDEEIKEDDWCFGMDGIFQYKGKVNLSDVELPKKIILTTDPNLIKDGVQAIDDTFLEWFVKNPSCEFVEVEKTFVTNSGLGYQEYAVLNSDFKVLEVVATRPQSSYKIGSVTKLDDYEYVTEYKIIIPQEEAKQESVFYQLEVGKELEQEVFELGEETLEEATRHTITTGWDVIDDLMDGGLAKGELGVVMAPAERMYSEEDFKLFARLYYREIRLNKSNLLWDDLADKCLEQFKKK